MSEKTGKVKDSEKEIEKRADRMVEIVKEIAALGREFAEGERFVEEAVDELGNDVSKKKKDKLKANLYRAALVMKFYAPEIGINGAAKLGPGTICEGLMAKESSSGSGFLAGLLGATM